MQYTDIIVYRFHRIVKNFFARQQLENSCQQLVVSIWQIWTHMVLLCLLCLLCTLLEVRRQRIEVRKCMGQNVQNACSCQRIVVSCQYMVNKGSADRRQCVRGQRIEILRQNKKAPAGQQAGIIDIFRAICYNQACREPWRRCLRREVCFMEQLILYIILAFILLEILKTIKK